MERITSRQNRIVAQYRAAARGDADDLLLLDGTHLVSDALTAGVRLHHLMVAAEALAHADIQPLVERATSRNVDVAIASAPVMAAASPVRSSSPIIALAARPSLESRMFTGDQLLVIVACDVQDPGNLGAMARVAESAGAAGLMAVGQSADPFGWKAVRGSMGSALRLPIATRATAEEAVVEARRHGAHLVALAAALLLERLVFDLDHAAVGGDELSEPLDGDDRPLHLVPPFGGARSGIARLGLQGKVQSRVSAW